MQGAAIECSQDFSSAAGRDRVDQRACRAAVGLCLAGWRNIYVLDWGLNTWAASGNPLEAGIDSQSKVTSEKRAYEVGHNLGALHWEWKRALENDTLRLIDQARFLTEFLPILEAIKSRNAQRVVFYCQSGVRASHAAWEERRNNIVDRSIG